MPTPADYEALALRLIPKGHDRSRSELRTMIATTLTLEVEKALAKQRAENFPEIGGMEAALRARRNELEMVCNAALKQVAKDREAIADREQAVKILEGKMATLLQAFDAWNEWCNGGGEADENGKRFEAFRIARNEFSKERNRK